MNLSKIFTKKRCIIILLPILVLITYIISYGPVLPLLEKVYLPQIAYAAYEPVEFLRVHNNCIWKLTEWLYEKCGGEAEVGQRYFWATPRRELYYYRTRNGYISEEFFKNGISMFTRSFYPNGQIEDIRNEFPEDGVDYQRWDINGRLIFKSQYFRLRYPDGKKLLVSVESEYPVDGPQKVKVFDVGRVMSEEELKDAVFEPADLSKR